MEASHSGGLERARSRWVKVIDQTRCIGCHACTVACKSENEVPVGVTRTYVKAVETGLFPQVRRAFQVTRCNQCADAPCVTACPTSAMYKRRDGIVDFAKSVCIGCKACIAACPYDAIFINPDDRSAEKCNFCTHRLDLGLEPACVVVCPTEAILVGDLKDPASKVARLIHREAVAVRRPEKDTAPQLFYKGAHQATLDPLGAQRPEGGLFMWSEQGGGPHATPSGRPGPEGSSAAALLAYDVPHRAPWHWQVSLYTWTKSIAAGTYLLMALLVALGYAASDGPLWLWGTPLVAGLFLAATGALLVGDLEHPERFHLIFIRPQWRSWLVRGAFIIAAYSVVLAAHGAGSLLGLEGRAQLMLAVPGVPLAVMTAVYTAYLFAQARGRDLWQSPLLPGHLFVQAALGGSAILSIAAAVLEPEALPALLALLAVSCLVHLLLVWGETTLAHVTANAALACAEMTRGRFRTAFRFGLSTIALGVVAPWIGVVAAPVALAGLMAYEHAYVQSAQAVPLA